METAVRGGPPRRRIAALSKEDVRALFRLMAVVAQGEDSSETLAFSGQALAKLFDSYADHLVDLMDRWTELSTALQSDDATRRALTFRQCILRKASNSWLIRADGQPISAVGPQEAVEIAHIILGKGMEL